MRYWLVMPAAGAGRRFGGAKQFAALHERTVLELALQPFIDDPQCVGGSIALSAGEPRREELARRLPARFETTEGGGTRAHSVLNGLAALAARAAESDWVLVHDAARPCLSAGDLARLLAGLSARAAGGDAVQGALLAVPVADTVKQAEPKVADEPARCARTLSRDSLWLAQTPQTFRLGALRAALEQALSSGRMPTDEAQAMEWQGVSARLIEARDTNIKVTGAADLLLAQAILQARAAGKDLPA
jgi:2-C-methyl-D-erythritol 4-phosphate cytidylyltransferase